MAAKTSNGSTVDIKVSGKTLTISGGNGVDVINLQSIAGSKGADGTWTINAAGGNGDDTITGSQWRDVIWGDSLGNSGSASDNGADTLSGAAGDDEIHGGNGADVIAGDAGADRLSGDRGGDRFVYRLSTDSGLGSAADTITDFTASSDKIDVAALRANPSDDGPDELQWGGAHAGSSGAPYSLWYNWNGASTEVYADTDGDGLADFQIHLVGNVALAATDFIGVNRAPTASADQGSTDEDNSVSIAVLSNDSDPDGDNLVVSNASVTSGLGSASVGSGGANVTYDPGTAYNYLAVGESASVTISYTISDGHGGSSTASVTVTVTGANDGPTAAADQASVDEDHSTSILVLANDTDPDTSDVLQVTGVTVAAGGLGTAAVSEDGASVSYSAAGAYDSLAEGEEAEVELEYTISDGHGGTSSSTVSVTVTGVNDAAGIAGDLSGAVTEDGDPTIGGTVSVSDADHDQSVFAAVDPDALVGEHGTFTMDAATGAWSYTLDNDAAQGMDADDVAYDALTITSLDGTATETITVTINGANDEAEFGGTDSGAVIEDGVQSASGSVSVSDADHDQSGFQAAPAAALAGTYGDFTFDETSGAWSYALRNGDANVQALTSSDHVTDTLVVRSTDGTTHDIVVSVSGADEGPALPAAYTLGGDPRDFDGVTGGGRLFSQLSSSQLNNDNILFGTSGNDTINAQNGVDTVYGWGGNDVIDGGQGVDTVYGGSGDDTIRGSQANDGLFGGSGSDVIYGDQDDDLIVGGYGADTLSGAQGADRFAYLSVRDTNDTILDFVHGTDVIDVDALNFNTPVNSGAFTAAHDLVWFVQGGNTVVLGDTDGDLTTAEFMVTLNGVTTLSAGDFVI
jgi:VCBS repeat-containing protein